MKILSCVKPYELRYLESPVPQIPPGHALIKIKRVGVCGTDLHAFEGKQPYFNYPRVLGHELSGDVAELNGVSDFKPGEAVTIIPYFNCGNCGACSVGKYNCCVRLKVCGVHQDGGLAEYLVVPISSLVYGQGLGYDELALIEPFAIGAHAVNRAGINSDDTVLVMGAGPIGMACITFAKQSGAKVIVADRNAFRLNFCTTVLGADLVINIETEDALALLNDYTNGQMPSVIMDATGNLAAINSGFNYMAHGGKYVLVGLQGGDISFSHPEFHKREGILMSSRNALRADFDQVLASVVSGSVQLHSFITHRLNFVEVVSKFSLLLSPSENVVKAIVIL
ncbi:zinc-binding alcohol dehydrogenase family protein [Mucilaginibacter gynuensis]|uniref:Zinc-binding alcohol dehydrogenase family protein n=1 Tax=Mucilaginibacter gynuensis TaxID=1302236 RepID=A0ABP8G3H5_9SPHI